MSECHDQFGLILIDVITVLFHYFLECPIINNSIDSKLLKVLIEIFSVLVISHKSFFKFTEFLHVDSFALEFIANVLYLLVEVRGEGESGLLFWERGLGLSERADVVFIEPLGFELVVETREWVPSGVLVILFLVNGR
jgi:hypothetical protein